MIKRYGVLILAGVVGLVLIGAGVASEGGQNGRCPNPVGMGMRMHMMAAHHHIEAAMKELEFTEQQRTDMVEMMKERHLAMEDKIKNMALARGDLFFAIHSESFDETAVRQACRAVAALEEEISVEKARIAQEIHKIMTPTQMEQARVMLQTWRDEFINHVNNHDLHEHMEECHGHTGDCGGHGGSFMRMLKNHFHGDGCDNQGKGCPHGHDH